MIPIDFHYENAKLARVYDVGNGWSADRAFYAALPGPDRQRILDLGCGTGMICCALAAMGHDVTGCDPSAAMLDVARNKQDGATVEWVQASAQSFASAKRFDLVIMTGHAFQVLVNDADVQAALAVVNAHLAPGGRLVFETRNPAIDWPAVWNYDVTLKLPDVVVHEQRCFVSMERGRMTFDLHFKFPDERLLSRSELRFWTQEQVEAHLAVAGLRVESLLGDWDRRPFEDNVSEEMIFVVRSRSTK